VRAQRAVSVSGAAGGRACRVAKGGCSVCGRGCGAGGVSVRSGGRSSVSDGWPRERQAVFVGGGGRRCEVALVMGAGGLFVQTA
jgi:hypothetical protein